MKQKTAVLKGNEISTDKEIIGPAIIEEETTTVVLPPGTSGRLSANGNYVIEWRD